MQRSNRKIFKIEVPNSPFKKVEESVPEKPKPAQKLTLNL